MIIPHLVLAHLLADYVLQTDWLAQSKTSFVFRDKSSWGGLLLHGSMVWFVSLMVLPNYIDTIWPYITLIAVAHTLGSARSLRCIHSSHMPLTSLDI